MRQKTPQARYWLFKSEPEAFSIDDLAVKNVAVWDGVRNYQVRNVMRDEMQMGDRALFYHSSTKDVGVVGEMEVVGTAFADPLQFDETSQYYEPKSTKEVPRWLAVNVKYIQKFPRLVPLSELRNDPVLAGMRILERGNRLSITPISVHEYTHLIALGKQI